eukprot:gene11101-14896_t
MEIHTLKQRYFNRLIGYHGERIYQENSCTQRFSTAYDNSKDSIGIESTIQYLNSQSTQALLTKLAYSVPSIQEESSKQNFWSGGNFVIKNVTCVGIVPEGIALSVLCEIKGKNAKREVVCLFNEPVNDDISLKRVLVSLANNVNRIQDTGDIMRLPFGDDCSMPEDFRFNDVPHATWVRSYIYNVVTDAVVKAVNDDNIPNKSRLQLKVNFPEVNPAFDTYRIGTILEMVRNVALSLVLQENKKVRICVQQALGEGIFVGLPLALASMRTVLESMDWGNTLTKEQKFQKSDNNNRRSEAMIRLGAIGKDELADDDDVIIVIAPQNVIGGMIIEVLDEMVRAANGRPVILINPSLADRPSSNNNMQIRGRSDRKAIENSFKDIFALRLLYPSSGGYMYPIRGMIAKKDYHSPWVVYSKSINEQNKEIYDMIGAFDAYNPPDPSFLSSLFVGK